MVALVLVALGSGGLRWFDSALVAYLFGMLFAMFAVTYRPGGVNSAHRHSVDPREVMLFVLRLRSRWPGWSGSLARRRGAWCPTGGVDARGVIAEVAVEDEEGDSEHEHVPLAPHREPRSQARSRRRRLALILEP
jgi:hypothetical protein